MTRPRAAEASSFAWSPTASRSGPAAWCAASSRPRRSILVSNSERGYHVFSDVGTKLEFVGFNEAVHVRVATDIFSRIGLTRCLSDPYIPSAGCGDLISWDQSCNSAIWVKFNELPAGNYSTWDHGHSTPSRWTTFYTHIVISTDKITGSSSLSPTPSQTRAEPHSHICKSRCRTPGAQSCRAYTSPKSEPGSLWLMSWTCSASSPANPLGIRCAARVWSIIRSHHWAGAFPRIWSNISTDVSNADRLGINWICTPQWPGWASSRRLSRYASSSIERFRGCSTEHRPRPGQWVDSPLISPAVTKWSRVQPANWLDPESGRTIRAATAQVVPTGLPKWCPFCL